LFNEEKDNGKNKRGRPIGFKLSEESKKAISEAKVGQKHSQETKDKISRSLILYFKKQHPLSDEIEKRYCSMDEDLQDWATSVRNKLNEITDVMTSRSMRVTRRIEMNCGNNIEYFGHNLTPEIILLFKEFCELNNLDPLDVLDKLGV